MVATGAQRSQPVDDSEKFSSLTDIIYVIITFWKEKTEVLKDHILDHVVLTRTAEIEERHQQAIEEWDHQIWAIQYDNVELKVASQTSLQRRAQAIV